MNGFAGTRFAFFPSLASKICGLAVDESHAPYDPGPLGPEGRMTRRPGWRRSSDPLGSTALIDGAARYGNLAAMFGPRHVRLFICLVSLAVAGCANNSVQETSGPPRPQTVVVNDLVVSPDVVIIDRDFAVRLESKLGTMTGDVVKAITAKRVNDEIAATVVVLVGAAGFNARPARPDDAVPKNALVIAGQLRPLDQSNRQQRNPVVFGTGSGLVADMTVSQVAEGAEKQLLSFTAQAANGRLPGGAALNAAIATVLAAKSAPDVNLSPGVEGEARGLGRAIADKIIAYAEQQGWATKSYSPAQFEETKPATNRPDRRPVAAARQDGSPSSAKSVPCQAFTKNERGHWYVKGPVTFDIGTAENQTLQDVEIPPKFFIIGGVDLYDLLEKKCSGWHPTVKLR
jgi:hypothetical protein